MLGCQPRDRPVRPVISASENGPSMAMEQRHRRSPRIPTNRWGESTSGNGPDPPRPIRGTLAARGGVEFWEVADAVAERSVAAAIVAEHEHLMTLALAEARSLPADQPVPAGPIVLTIPNELASVIRARGTPALSDVLGA
jgi:hypothetical protein